MALNPHAPASPAVDGGAPEARQPSFMMLITLAETGGVNSYAGVLLPALTESFDVVVCASGEGPLRDATRAAGARYHALRHIRRNINPARDVLALLELIVVLRRIRPDIVHANSSKMGILGRLAAWITGVPIRIFTVHGWAFAAYAGIASWLFRWADRLVRPLTSVIICPAHAARDAGIREKTCTSDRTVVIPNGVEVGRIVPVPRPSRTARIVSVGRLQFPKDFATLVRALARVPPGSFEAWIVGDGRQRDALEDELAQLGLERTVTFLGPRKDVPKLLLESDIFALSSGSECMPIAVLEAMASGLPIVATAVGGLPEMVDDGESGSLVPPFDVAALADAISRLLGDAELRRRLGEAARARVERDFNAEDFRRAHIELYTEQLAARGLPTPQPPPSRGAGAA